MIPFQLHRRIPLLRRPFYQRDRAMEERDRAVAERDALEESLKSASREGDQARAAVGRLNEEMRSAWLRHRPPELLTRRHASASSRSAAISSASSQAFAKASSLCRVRYAQARETPAASAAAVTLPRTASVSRKSCFRRPTSL